MTYSTQELGKAAYQPNVITVERQDLLFGKLGLTNYRELDKDTLFKEILNRVGDTLTRPAADPSNLTPEDLIDLNVIVGGRLGK